MAIMAWRYWRWGVMEHHDSTTSIILHGLWGTRWEPDQVMHAKCQWNATGWRHKGAAGRDLPVVNCTCGIYALKSVDETLTSLTRKGSNIGAVRHDQNSRYLYIPKAWYLAQGSVLGVVELWGKIITAENGYRAQHGQLRALVCAPDKVADVYAVPNLPSVEYAQREYFA